MPKLKIAVWYHLASGGAKRALHDHIVGLQRRGHTVEIWRPPVDQRQYLDLSRLATEHEIPLGEFRRTSRFYPRRIFLNVTEVDRFVEVMDAHSSQCAEQIAAGGFDLLFANTDLWFHAPRIGQYLERLPRVLYLQEPNRPFHEASPRLKWLLPPGAPPASRLKRARRAALDLIENRTVRMMATTECDNAQHYERILVNSRFSRESILRTYGRDSRVCYLGIDPGLFEYRGLPRERFVMSVGSMAPSKNPRLILEGVGRIPKAERPALVWPFNSGEESFVQEMRDLAQSLEVDFQPRRLVPDEELVDLLNRASAFVYAPRLEPFGLAPLEANACRTPVVAVAEGGVRETVEDGVNGVLVEHDPDAVAEGVRSLLADPERARRLGEQGERLVREKWSVDAAAERLERQFIEVVEGKKRE